ncbi:uncharacterized protein LOC141700311 [Apium graveolens]|uniref:uncharacterized protein LOC141700311 n=1 Tax=Apium graveolens TaxID=4045 RepID=UPI003D790EBA
MGLHSSYTAARGQLLMMSPWPSVNQAFMLLKQEERQRQFHNSTSSPVAMMVNVSKPQNGPTAYIQNRFSDRAHPVQECAHCHIKGHTKERCYKLVGYPVDHPYHPNNKGKRRFSNSNVKAVAVKPQAMQVSGTQYTSLDSSNEQHLTSKMDALQTQLNSIMQCLSKGGSHPQAPEHQFSLATHLAGPIPEEGIGSW